VRFRASRSERFRIFACQDRSKIEVRASIKSDMEDALRDETQFWLVTPKRRLPGFPALMHWWAVTISA
jgi:hypothetical protein